jgi:molybdopterin molybdotransferase
MLSVEQALQMVLENAVRRPTETIALTPAALGLVLAEEVASDLDMPPYDKALVDGYAVRSADLGPASVRAHGAEAGLAVTSLLLKVIEEIPAGHVPRFPLRPNQVARIMTGAMLPPGADAVIMSEKVETVGGGAISIYDQNVKPGQNVMPRGREMRQNEIVLQAGALLRPQELGLLAAVGRNAIQVYRQPQVCILSTGDELVEPAVEPGPGQIRNSNATLLAGQLTRAGARPQYLGIARDSTECLRLLIGEGLQGDMLLLTGGVSAGQLDLVPGVLQELGVLPVFHKVAMKPGKPLFFGRREDTLVFGLPGNPVSALVGFELFVRPALNVMLGRSTIGPRMLNARLAIDFTQTSDRRTYHPAQLTTRDDGWQVTPVAWFGSPDLRSITRANSFAVFEPGERQYRRGELVPVLMPE